MFIKTVNSTGLINRPRQRDTFKTFAFLFFAVSSVCFVQATDQLVTVHTLEEALHSSDVSERISAARAIAEVGSTIQADDIKNARDSEKDPLVRHRINQAMAQGNVGGFEKNLMDSLKFDPSPMVRQGAAQTLGNYLQSSGIETALIKALLEDGDASVRYAAALSLGLSNTPDALNALEKASTDLDPALRRQVAFSLKRHLNKRSKAILNRMKNDSDSSVRLMAGAEK